jgi:hypothetical protein
VTHVGCNNTAASISSYLESSDTTLPEKYTKVQISASISSNYMLFDLIGSDIKTMKIHKMKEKKN